MKINLSNDTKPFLSFDLKDLLWLILVVGVWATQDYRIKYTNNVLKCNGDLQEKIGQLNAQIGQLKETIETSQPALMNICQFEGQAIKHAKDQIKEFPSISRNEQVFWLNHLYRYLKTLTDNKEYLDSQLEALRDSTFRGRQLN